MSHAIESFFAAWGESNPDIRETVLRASLSDKVSYADPRTSGIIPSVDELVEYVGMYTQMAPGATARLAGLSETQNSFRATVEFRLADGRTQLGQYFIETDDQSHLCRMVGFVGLGEPE
ncbi:hypothetical protein SAMN05444000_104127 [Shimia gijangensis]|uniref:SnoaL-like domain-containing protein n=1 Tax=Shimia gijangensis TaxID=1470563 RepID=A0A1M6FP65_9RHOB|nr:hypothetical protein [Shimia gijangensis]SHI99472.1 hypothetical protein SAMN05444000_104127 [Shimia gijangensis]